jgi:hypothetical protein
MVTNVTTPNLAEVKDAIEIAKCCFEPLQKAVLEIIEG